MSRHRNMKNYIDEAEEEEDYDNEAQEYGDYDEEEDIIYILENIEYAITREKAKALLEKFDYDAAAAIQYFLSNKIQKAKEESKKELLKIQKSISNDSSIQKPSQQQRIRKLSSQEIAKQEKQKQEDQQSAMPQSRRKISSEVLDTIEEKKIIDETSKKKNIKIDLKRFNSTYPQIPYEIQFFIYLFCIISGLQKLSNLNTKIIQISLLLDTLVKKFNRYTFTLTQDSGKSTLIGHLLYLLKEVTQKTIHKYETQSQQIGKSSFHFAWVMDQSTEERNHGVTIDSTWHSFCTESKSFTIIDTPGHKDFLPNLLTGITQCDVGILILDAALGAFEVGVENGGQTFEHLMLMHAIGVQKLIIVCNKMDLVKWDHERIEIMQNKMQKLIKSIGLEQDAIIWTQASAINGENLIERKEKEKPSLIEILNSLEIPNRNQLLPLRLTISNVFQSNKGKLKGQCLEGKVEGGMLIPKQRYLIMPGAYWCTIKDILVNDEKVKAAQVGITCEVLIQCSNETEFNNLRNGNILSSIDNFIPISQLLKLEIVTYNLDYPILKGSQIVVHLNAQKSQATITRLESLIDNSQVHQVKKNPKCVKSNQCAVIEIQLKEILCVELYRNFKAYGRVILREKQNTLAIGTIIEIK